ncbi:MAG: MBL fold metallo-hydrolase [Acidimicrobiia bacterium]|nr:MBL fold metallo-hydrolase [Acidimicrobiia bacterium]
MKVILTGTGSPIPDANRAGPSTLVQCAGQNILIDCGRGVAMRLVAAGVPAPFLSAILVTHLHSDHITDLNDLVTTRWILSPEATPTVIYGPLGTKKVVDGMMAMLTPDQKYRHDHHADLRSGPGLQVVVHEVVPGDEFKIGDARVIVGRTDHRPVTPTIGFRIEAEGKSVVSGVAADVCIVIRTPKIAITRPVSASTPRRSPNKIAPSIVLSAGVRKNRLLTRAAV